MEEGKVCSPNSGEMWLLVGSENVLQDFLGIVPCKRAQSRCHFIFVGKLAIFKVMRFQGNCSKMF